MKLIARSLLAVLAFGLIAPAAQAQTNSWIDSNGKWENSNNWSRFLAPSASDAADLITNAGNNVVVIDLATTTNAGGASMTINRLIIVSNTLALANAGLATPLQIIGPNGGLNVSTNGSVVISNSYLKVVSQTPFVDGSLLLDGGLLVNTNPPVANTFYVGLSTPGRMTLSNGMAVLESMRIEPSSTLTMAGTTTSAVRDRFENFGSTWITGGQFVCTNLSGEVRSLGQMTVSNGTVVSKFLEVGFPYLQDGSLTVNGGTVLATTSLTIGGSTNGFGYVTVAGGSLSVTNVAGTGVTDVRYGTLVLTGGVFNTDSLLVTNSHGSFINNGGAFNVTGPAHTDQGTQVVSSGSTTFSSNFWVGSTLGSTGTLIVAGGTLTVTNGVFAVGNDGTVFGTGGVAHVTVSSGLVQAASILIGDHFGGDSGFRVTNSGHVRVTGGLRSNGIKTTLIDGGTLEIVDGPPPPFEDPAMHDRIVVSYLGDGKMIVSNGTVLGLEMVVGLASGQGTFEMAGGSVNLSSNLLVGMTSTATGVVTVTGGSISVTNGVFGVGSDGTLFGVGGVGHVTLSNGVVEAASVLIGDNFGSESSFTVAGTGLVRSHGGLRSNGIKTTVVNGGTLEVVDGPLPPFEDPILFDRIVVSYLADGRMIVSNGTVRTPGMLVGASPPNTGTLELPGGTTSVFSNMTVGFVACTATGIVNVTGGNLFVTNSASTAVLEVRSGTFTISSGTVIVDNLVLTSACGHLLHTGGTLLYSGLVLDPNLSAVGDGIPNWWKQQYNLDPFDPGLASKDTDGDGMSDLQEYLAGTDPTNNASSFRITAVAKEANNLRVTWTMGSGKTNALQAAPGLIGGGYNTNNFADIFTVTNTVGTVTNYPDGGAATNFPSRYYRVRLVP